MNDSGTFGKDSSNVDSKLQEPLDLGYAGIAWLGALTASIFLWLFWVIFLGGFGYYENSFGPIGFAFVPLALMGLGIPSALFGFFVGWKTKSRAVAFFIGFAILPIPYLVIGSDRFATPFASLLP